jgi:hypothetical protein
MFALFRLFETTNNYAQGGCMNLKLTLAGSLLALSAVQATAATLANNCINKDLRNLGPTAYDIGVLITGNQPVTWHFDGYFGTEPPPPSPKALHFSSFTPTLAGANEFLHWQNANGKNDPILTGDIIHVGWCTAKPTDIIDMWWTDLRGARVAGSVVQETSAHQWNGGSTIAVQWNNAALQTAAALRVADVNFNLSPTPWNLDQLNRQNTVLAEGLRPLPGGTSFDLAPGASVQLPVPGAVAGQWIVLRYSVSGSVSQADSTDYVQFQLQ